LNPTNLLLVEKYRPSKIEDCVLSKDLTDIFNGIIQSGQDEFPNMIFCGPAGVGKTTVAKALASELGMTSHLINASEENGIDTLRTTIKRFASTKSLSGGKKLMILDEADHLSQAAQPALRGLIEQFSSNCRFILTCNYKNKIIDPLISRCPIVDFTIPNAEKQDIAGRIFTRICSILNEEGVAYEEDTVVQVVLKNFPDFRRMLGKIQQYTINDTLDPSVVSSSNSNESMFDDVFKIMGSKKFKELRLWVCDHSDMDLQVFFSDLDKYLWKMYADDKLPITKQSLAYLIPIMAEHAYKSNFIADDQISMMAFLSTVMVEVEFV